MRNVAVGIDIGTSAVTTVAARREKSGKLRILGVGESAPRGMRRGCIVDAAEVASALRRSIAEAGRASGFAIRSAVVSVGGSHLGSFVARGAVAISRADGEITEEDVARAMRAAEGFAPKNPNRELVHLIPRAFRVDGEGGIADPVGMVGMKLEAEALGIDGAKSALANIIKCCELVGVEIDDWVAGMLAAAEVLLTKEQKELGVMLLDLGAGTSDYAVFEEGRLVDAGVIPIGGARLTADIAIGLKVPAAAAEEIKRRYAQAVLTPEGARRTMRLAEFVNGDESTFTLRDLTDIVSARLTDIFELATKALKRAGRAGLLPGGVVLTGGLADIPGVPDLARRELKLPVEVSKAVAHEAVADVVPPRLALPLGLILWQMQRRTSGRAGRRWGGAVEGLKRLLRAFVP